MKKASIVCLIALVGLFQACGGAKSIPQPCGAAEKRGKFKAYVNPRQIQVELVKILAMAGDHATLGCVTPQGDSVVLRYGWAIGVKPYRILKTGTKFTVEYDSIPCEPGRWIAANIRINK